MNNYHTKDDSIAYILDVSYDIKWLFFFVIIRPWLEIILTLVWLFTTFADIVPYALDTNSKKAIIIIILSLAYTISLCILQLRVFFSSVLRASKLLKCIDNLLSFECYTFGLRCSAIFPGTNGIVLGLIMFIPAVLIWYGPNIKYFTKRLVVKEDDKKDGVSPALKQEPLVTTSVQIETNAPIASEKTPPKPMAEEIPDIPLVNPFTTNPQKKYRQAECLYRTLKGDLVRSKSEVIIANMLYDAGIQYEYEKELNLGIDGIRLPDFTIQIPGKNKIYYWEHCGMLDDSAYRRRWMQKLQVYRRHNIIEGKNLIVTRESQSVSLDSAEIWRLIETYLRDSDK